MSEINVTQRLRAIADELRKPDHLRASPGRLAVTLDQVIDDIKEERNLDKQRRATSQTLARETQHEHMWGAVHHGRYDGVELILQSCRICNKARRLA